MKAELRGLCSCALALALAACATWPPAGEPARTQPERRAADDASLPAMLAYYAAVVRNPAAAPRERGAANGPAHWMQQAILAGQGRPADLPRAMQLLEQVLRSPQPEAAGLQPLARLLYDQYGERLRGEQQVREAQRRSEQLQEKIDALTDIERRLPSPSRLPQELPR